LRIAAQAARMLSARSGGWKAVRPRRCVLDGHGLSKGSAARVWREIGLRRCRPFVEVDLDEEKKVGEMDTGADVLLSFIQGHDYAFIRCR